MLDDSGRVACLASKSTTSGTAQGLLRVRSAARARMTSRGWLAGRPADVVAIGMASLLSGAVKTGRRPSLGASRTATGDALPDEMCWASTIAVGGAR